MTKDTLFVGHVHRQTLHLANDKLKFAVVKKLNGLVSNTSSWILCMFGEKKIPMKTMRGRPWN